MPRIVIPDDAPPVMAASAAYRKLLEQTPVDYYDTLPGAEERLIERIGGAEVVISIRSSTRFTENVFRSCPGLRLVSLWGTGTDNVDLPSAARHGRGYFSRTPSRSSRSLSLTGSSSTRRGR